MSLEMNNLSIFFCFFLCKARGECRQSRKNKESLGVNELLNIYKYIESVFICSVSVVFSCRLLVF